MKHLGTKTRNEVEDQETERLVRSLPKVKPPRRDRHREQVQVDIDPDTKGDPDTKKDPDMSLNRREVGGSLSFFEGPESLNKLSSYSFYSTADCQMTTNSRTALYHGIQPYVDTKPYSKWYQARVQDLGEEDFSIILASAKTWLKSPILVESVDEMVPDSRFRVALDLAIRDALNGRYSAAINSTLYNKLLVRLAGSPQSGTLLTIHEASSQVEETMTVKIAKEEASKVLSRLDRIAEVIQANSETWGMPFEVARDIVNHLDKTADELEVAAFGSGSLLRRQTEVLKEAKVLQQDTDEGYMGTFNSPSAPKQTDSDEPYMSLFTDDQTEAVHGGKSTTGRPLAP